MSSSAQVVPPSEARVTAVLGFVAGIVGIILLVAVFVVPYPPSPPQTLSTYENNKAAYAFYGLAFGIFALGAVPFIGSLGRVLRSRGVSLASSATLLSAGGVLVFASGAILTVYALVSVSSTAAPSPAEATYQAALWSGSTSAALGIIFFGISAWGIGLMIFSALVWKSGILPNWLAIVGFVGGIAGLSAATPWGVVSVLILPVAFIIWAFATGARLRRVGSPSPA